MLVACPAVQTLVPSKPLDKRFPIISTICCSGCCRVLSGNTFGTKMLRLLATGSVDHWWCITRPSLGTTLSWGQPPHSRFHPPSLGQPASNVWSMQRSKVLLASFQDNSHRPPQLQGSLGSIATALKFSFSSSPSTLLPPTGIIPWRTAQ